MMESHVSRFRDVAPRDLTLDSTDATRISIFSAWNFCLSTKPFALMNILFYTNINEDLLTKMNLKLFN